MSDKEDIAGLPEDIASMVEYLDERSYPGSRTGEAWSIIRDELLRLTRNAGLEKELRRRACARAERAEAELAALKRKIAEAPKATVLEDTMFPSRGPLGMVGVNLPAAMIGQRVALLPVGGE